jgi:hypothetical protein
VTSRLVVETNWTTIHFGGMAPGTDPDPISGIGWPMVGVLPGVIP